MAHDSIATSAPSTPTRPRAITWIAIVFIAIIAAALSYSASRTKSATFDEPVHLLSSWLIVNRGDFRVNPEHPPLWKIVAGIPLIGTNIDLDLNSSQAKSVFEQIENQGPLATDTLFRNDKSGTDLLARSRLAMSVFLILTILVAARWAWSASCATAAIITAILLALDPNFLAHGTLLTNDVAASFIFVLAGYLTWCLGRRWCWKTAACLAITCAAGAGIKFTCVLLVPIVGVPLLIRALANSRANHVILRYAEASGRSTENDSSRDRVDPSAYLRVTSVGKPRQIARVLILALGTMCIAFVAIWSFYLFRAAPTPAGDSFDANYPQRYLAYNAIAKAAADMNQPLSDAEIKAAVPDYVPSVSMRIVYALQDHKLIPQALGYGLTYAAARGISRPAFLLGDYATNGFWLYFPVAIVTKTPLVTLAVLLTTLVHAIVHRKRWMADESERWLMLCLVCCPAIYLTLACCSNLNIGIRHILPIYPAMYVAAGITLAKLLRSARPARLIVPAALVLLSIETLSATPNYLAFFNRAAGGERGGLAVLGDSNLDWGQDLPALTDWYKPWRAEHPDEAFYFAYFGSVDPHVYGIDYTNMSPGFVYDTRPATLDLQRDGVVAISATWLQGTFPPELRPMMANLRARTPIAVINGSIYLYDFKKSVK